MSTPVLATSRPERLSAASVPLGWDFLQRQLHQSLTDASHGPLAVVVFDLDRLRSINDSFGRSFGDQVIRVVGSHLASVTEPFTTVAHLGGDEFAILLPDRHEIETVVAEVERIQESFQQPFLIGGRELFISVSAGIVLESSGDRTPESCVRDAETAMYEAKASCGSGCAVFEPGMRTRRLEDQGLESELRAAIARDQFEVHYQPIVSLTRGVVSGFEALVRWRHPRLGLIPPHRFIPVAEQTGLIATISWRVLELACRQLSAWHTHTAEPPFLSVNLCERQLLQADGAAHVERILERSRCSAGRLRLELTETMIMENAGQVIQRMSELAGLGVGLCLDDFGTGYSSLSYLDQLPVQTIKIDRSFVSPGAGRLEILRAILGLAHTLGMSAEAEGIETGAQLARLRELGCEHGQGFVFSQAVPGLKARQLLGNRFPQ